MSGRKNETPGNSPWGKTSRFTYKNAAKRNPTISKEEKERFLTFGTLPKFKSTQRSEKWLQKKYSIVETDLLQESVTILNKVLDEFGNEGGFIEAAYGKRISMNRASEVIHNYLVEHGIDGMMSVCFTSEMDCSGKMQWTGPMTKYNQPERRNYSMWVKTTSDNIYFRETGILNLTNHEIGTHFFRSVNDGLQPWFSNRTKFGLCAYKDQDLKDTEEGLAALNTTFEAKVKYIWGPAMLYYTACMSLEMNFKELFEHLGKYVSDPEIRWKYVVRVKRGRSPAQLGGNGKDQCYFRGVVHILRNIDSINFLLLYAGKITVDDQFRVQRLARLGCIKTPYFLKDMNGYRRYMRNLAKINGISRPKLMPRGPELKLSLPKTPRHNLRGDKFNDGNQPAKKSPKLQMRESRQRIMSSKLLSKAKRRLLDDVVSDDKQFCLVGETLMIEHEPDDVTDVPPEGDEDPYSPDASFSHASLNMEEEDKRISPIPPQKVFLAGRRRSDSCCSPTIRSPPREDRRESPDEGDSGRSEKIGCCATDGFRVLSRKHEKFRPTESVDSMAVREKKIQEIGDMFITSDRPHQNEECAIIPSCASMIGQTLPKTPPNAALQLVREIPSTPKSTPSSGDRRNSTINTLPPLRSLPKQRLTQRATPSPLSGMKRKGSSSSRTSSSTTTTTSATSKRSLKKNITLFFEDLVPFSKSRRKRVVPLS